MKEGITARVYFSPVKNVYSCFLRIFQKKKWGTQDQTRMGTQYSRYQAEQFRFCIPLKRPDLHLDLNQNRNSLFQSLTELIHQVLSKSIHNFVKIHPQLFEISYHTVNSQISQGLHSWKMRQELKPRANGKMGFWFLGFEKISRKVNGAQR